jgi:hypothetical protein
VIYDTGGGIGAFAAAPDFEAYGNVIFNNGWYAPDRGHGHGVYTQNVTGSKLYENNVILGQFGNTFQIYGSNKAYFRNISMVGNVLLNGSVLLGGGNPLENFVFDSNNTYARPVEFGIGGAGGTNIRVTNNFLMGGASFSTFSDMTATGNTVYSASTQIVNRLFSLDQPASAAFVFDRNSYYQFAWSTVAFAVAGQSFGFADWQKLGFDLQGSFTKTAAPRYRPTGSNVFVRANKYDADRAVVAIYNWSLNSSVAVDLSSVLSVGDSYELRNTLDYFNDVITGTYAGGSVSIPMTGRTMGLPLGYASPLGSNTFPEFGSFVLQRTRRTGTVVTVTPGTSSLRGGQAQQFTASVTGTTNTAVNWSVNPAVGSISGAGLYTPPSLISTAQTVKVTATSAADTAVSSSATVQLNPVSVSVSSPSSSVGTGRTLQFAASVANAASTAVTWTLVSGPGTLSAAGLYTAPASLSATQSAVIKATSVADPTRSASVTISVVPVITISISPSTASIVAGSTVQLSAFISGSTNTAVTWSLNPAVGCFTATGLYASPASVASPQSVVITASSVADPTKSVAATVTVTPPPVTAPAPAPAPSLDNLLVNWGFEASATGWARATNGGRSISSAVAHSGLASLQMAGSTAYDRAVYQQILVSPGQILSLSAWIKTYGVTAAGSMSVQWLNTVSAGDVPTAGQVIRRDVVASAAGTTPWQQVSGTVTAPAGARAARVEFTLPPNPATALAWFDDVDAR